LCQFSGNEVICDLWEMLSARKEHDRYRPRAPDPCARFRGR
jgi:hypothetical protein